MCGNIRFMYHLYLPLLVYKIVMVSGTKVMKVIKETRPLGSSITFRLGLGLRSFFLRNRSARAQFSRKLVA